MKDTHQSYQELLGEYIPKVSWEVRFADFTTDPTQTRKEYTVFISEENKFFIQEKTAENEPGKKLTESAAREVAHKYLKQNTTTNFANLSETSAESIAQLDRTDWLFKFQDSSYPIKEKGKATLSIYITGDKVTSFQKYISVPEDWRRNYNAQNQRLNNFNYILIFCIYFIIALSCVKGIQHILQKRFNTKYSLIISIIFILSFSSRHLLNLPHELTFCTTSELLSFQIFSLILNLIPSLIINTLWVGLTIGYIYSLPLSRFKASKTMVLFLGISIGILLAGLSVFVKYKVYNSTLDYPSIAPLSAYIPFASFLLEWILGYFKQALYLLFVVIIIPFNKPWIAALTVPLLSSLLINVPTLFPLWIWFLIIAIYSLILFIIYHFILRYDSTLVPLIASISTISDLAFMLFSSPYPGANYYSVGTMLIIFALSIIWTYSLRMKRISRI